MQDIISATVRTMTSREIAELVEARHNDVVATIERLFSKGLLRSSRETRRESTGGRPLDVYDLIERDTHLVVSGYSDEHRARVIDRWEALETGRAQPLAAANGPSNLEQLQMAEVLASALRLDGSSRLKLMADATKLLAPALAPLLPAYAIDAPAGAPAVSSERTLSLTSLMARHRVGVSTRTANLRLQQLGLIEKATRPSSSGQVRSFWSVTEEGLEYGKNVVHPENPRETQPHWFAKRGADLLRLMGVLE